MEIKSSLVNSSEFSEVKKSLIEVSEIDGKEAFRIKMLEYINDTADNNDDMFFFDMLEFVRFLNPSDKSIAYTTPDRLIFLNSPSAKIGETVREWDFVYCHECLHQLWDTFDVGKQIKEAGHKYDHYVLNIASDCVINDYLSYYRKKTTPSDLITPEYIKEKYGIEYDRKTDTQYSLYLKLLEEAEKLKNDERIQQNMDMDAEGDGEGESQEGEGSGSGQQDSSNQDRKGDKGNKQDQSGSGKSSGDSGGDQEEKTSGSGSGDQQDQPDDKSGDQTKNASSGENNGGEGEGEESEESGKSAGKGKGTEKPVNNSAIKAKADEIIERYRSKISGAFGEFIKKCKSSTKCDPNGLEGKAQKGMASWNTKMNNYINTFVKNRVFQKKRQYESTYSRVKRGSGFIEYGKPITPGRKIKEDKMIINTAFYIDRSGSMDGCIDNVFSAVFTIAEALKKQFGKDKVVDKTEFKTFVFNDSMSEVKFGSRASAYGGTMSFDQILNFISKNTKEYLINVIVTDAQFSIDSRKVNEFLKDIDGLVIFITNCNNDQVKKISEETANKTKLAYILASNNFNL